MRRAILGLLCLWPVWVVAGCAGPSLKSQGDAYLLSNRPGDAVSCYEQALARDPDLAADASLVSQLRRARGLVAYDLGRQQAAAGRWDDAVDRFRHSVEQDPSLERAKAALKRAQREASKVHHKKALEHADRGQFNQAIVEFKKALELDPGNLDAKDALDSIQKKKQDSLNRAQKLYEGALALIGERRWGRASAALEQAFLANRNHLPCRAAMTRARERIAAAKRLCTDGANLLTARRLDGARKMLTDALDIWPFYPEARELLGKADSFRKQADDLYRKALGLAGANKWDEAFQAAVASVQAFPFDQKSQALLRRATHEAAAAHHKLGTTLLANGELAKAEKEFVHALGYLPKMPEAKQGLAEADVVRGDEAAKKAHWGSALLWYMLAADHVRSKAHDEKVKTARKKVVDRIRLVVQVEVRGAAGAPPNAVAALEKGVLAQVSRTKPAFLQLAAAAKVVPAADYGAVVQLNKLAVVGGLARTEQRTFVYQVYRNVPNPEVPKLQGLLRIATGELEHLRQEYNRPCPACTGTGRLVCHTCAGTGTVRCRNCLGTGRVRCASCNGTGWRGGNPALGPCPRCAGRGTRTCAICGGVGTKWCHVCSTQSHRRGWVTCGWCRGTGRGSNVTLRDVSTKEREAADLQTRLQNEPATIRKAFPAKWEYVVKHYEKRGTAEAGLEVTDRARKALVSADKIAKSVTHRDTTIENANADIGLAEDGLELPSDDAVGWSLLDKTAAETASKLVSAVVAARAIALRKAAEALSEQKRPEDALEAKVDYVHTLEAVNARGAAQILTRLKDARRTHPDPERLVPDISP